MLIDKEPEELGELEVEEQKNELPEKYREKSLEEIVRMHQEAEKLIGKQAQEVGEVRKLADELIKQNLGSKQPATQDEPEVDFFENPQKAVQSTIDKHPDVVAAKIASQDFKKMQIQQKLSQEHPDFTQIVNDTGFQDWVKASPIRLGLYARAKHRPSAWGCMHVLMVTLTTILRMNCCPPTKSCVASRLNSPRKRQTRHGPRA